jgi:hypothetical protein
MVAFFEYDISSESASGLSPDSSSVWGALKSQFST